MSELFDAPRELLPSGSSSALYIPGAVDPSTADEAIQELLRTVDWSQPHVSMFGRSSPLPRFVSWVADANVEYRYSGVTTPPGRWTPLLNRLRLVAEQHALVRFNSVLLNAYLDGRHKVAWHSDDESVFGDLPTIASLSLGAERRFKLRNRRTFSTIEQRLGHGSLLVMSGACQQDWEHEIPREARVTAPRVNLTFRRIVSTSSEMNRAVR